jgi:hypothetical protein
MALVERTIRQLVQPWIKMWVRAGVPGTEMLETIRKVFGMAYRLEDFYSDIARYKKALEKVSKLLPTPRYQFYPEEGYTENPYIARKYEYVYKVKTRDIETGERKSREFVIDSNRKYTRRSVDRMAEERAEEYSKRRGEELEEIEIDTIYYNPELF